VTTTIHPRPLPGTSDRNGTATAAGPAPRTLLLEIRDDGDPVRMAHIVSSLVNNTRVALSQVTVQDAPVYPVAVTDIPDGNHREAQFRLRDGSLTLDGLLTEQVVAAVSTRYRVVAVWHVP
jgi:hypothetical protein